MNPRRLFCSALLTWYDTCFIHWQPGLQNPRPCKSLPVLIESLNSHFRNLSLNNQFPSGLFSDFIYRNSRRSFPEFKSVSSNIKDRKISNYFFHAADSCQRKRTIREQFG